jgi:hypothetical protein
MNIHAVHEYMMKTCHTDLTWFGARTKIISKLTFVVLIFPGYDGYLPSRIFIAHFEKIQVLPDS